MNYEWDPNKAKSNYKKHGIRFADAVGMFEDENAITIQDEHKHEDRYIPIGRDFLSRILVVVYTFRDIVIRITECRMMGKLEIKISACKTSQNFTY